MEKDNSQTMKKSNVNKKTGKWKHEQTIYTNDQIDGLEREYIKNPHLSFERRLDIAVLLELTAHQVKLWFRNRRAKTKREIERQKKFPARQNTRASVDISGERAADCDTVDLSVAEKADRPKTTMMQHKQNILTPAAQKDDSPNFSASSSVHQPPTHKYPVPPPHQRILPNPGQHAHLQHTSAYLPAHYLFNYGAVAGFRNSYYWSPPPPLHPVYFPISRGSYLPPSKDVHKEGKKFM